MAETIDDLERRRHEIAQQIAGLGDFRPGSVTSIRKKCGKAKCCCLEESHPGHGPHWRLTYKVDRKSYTESLTGEAIRKAEDEIAEFRRFQQLSREFVEVNTAICQRRSADRKGAVKKNGRRHPGGSHFRNRTVAESHIGRFAQVGTTRFGGSGNGDASLHASGRRNSFESTVTEVAASRGRSRSGLLLWPSSALRGDAAQTDLDGRGANLYPTALLPVPKLSRGTESIRRRVRCAGYGMLPWREADDGPGWQRELF